MSPQSLTNVTALSGPCPGPKAKSAAHAERCRACGKCGALKRLLGTLGEAGDAVVRVNFSTPLALASE